jgi:hypothetical protein
MTGKPVVTSHTLPKSPCRKAHIRSELGEVNLHQNSMSAWPVGAKGEMAMIDR